MSVGLGLEPSAELNCRSGYTELHAAFALLHLTVLGWFFYSAHRAPWSLHGLVVVGTAFNVAFHALLGGVCSSATVALAVHGQLAASLSHIRRYMFAAAPSASACADALGTSSAGTSAGVIIGPTLVFFGQAGDGSSCGWSSLEAAESTTSDGNSLISCALALHFVVLKSEGVGRAAKATFLVTMALLNVLTLSGS